MTNSTALNIGTDFAKLDLAADGIAQRVVDLLRDADYDAYGDHFEVMVAGYLQGRDGCTEDSAKRAIRRLCAKAGVTRPKSSNVSAKAKATQRKAGAPAAELAAAHAEKAETIRAEALKARGDGMAATAEALLKKAEVEAAKGATALLNAAAKAEKDAIAKAKAKAKDLRVEAAAMVKDASADALAAMLWAGRNAAAVGDLIEAKQNAELGKAAKPKAKAPRQRKQA